MKYKKFPPVLILFVLLLVACEGMTPVANTNAALDTPLPATLPPTATEVDPILRATMESAQATSAAQTQTALDIQRSQADATLIAAEIQAEQIRSQQTAIVASTQAAATAQSIAMTEQSAQITRAAEATATERAWLILGYTATADSAIATSTAQAAQAMQAIQGTQTQAAADALGTQTAATQVAAVVAMNHQATMDAATNSAASTAVAAQAVEAAAAAERTQMTNQFLAWFRIWAPILALLVILLVGFLIWRSHTRNRIIPRDNRGAAPLVIIDGQVTNPDLMMYPMLDENAGSVPADLQAAHAGHRAKVDAVRALPPGETHTGRRMVRAMANAPTAVTGTSDFTILTPDHPQASRLLPPPLRDALDRQWNDQNEDDE